jgi:hypothetical protein
VYGALSESLHRQVAEKQLLRGPDLAWAEKLVARHAAGETVARHSLKLANEALAERGHRVPPAPKNNL